MNKKILIGLFIVIILVATSAGCFENKPPKKKGTSYEESTSNYPPTSGWLDSDMGDSPQHVDSTVVLEINASEMITVITISMGFEDYDSDHSESDQGSDPDDVTITLTNGDEASEPATGTTPCQLNLQLQVNSTEADAYLSGTWEISVQAVCNPGKPYTLIPRPGQIWAPLTYKDQGIAYTLSATYNYIYEN